MQDRWQVRVVVVQGVREYAVDERGQRGRHAIGYPHSTCLFPATLLHHPSRRDAGRVQRDRRGHDADDVEYALAHAVNDVVRQGLETGVDGEVAEPVGQSLFSHGLPAPAGEPESRWRR
jgi:hypothetical protein